MKNIEIIDKLLAEEEDPNIKSTEFTLNEYRRRLEEKGIHMAYDTALRKLARMVRDGTLSVRKAICEGSKVNAYSQNASVEASPNTEKL